MCKIKYGLSLVLVSLILLACTHQVPLAPIRLPEPALPACLTESPVKAGEVVGGYEWKAEWLEFVAEKWDSDPQIAGQRVFACGGSIAQALREAVGIIRTFNSP